MPTTADGINADYTDRMGSHPDVLVIGGGVIGLTSAYFLAKSGLTVEVIDKGDLGREASWAGAGIIPPGNPERAATPIDRLRAASVSRFPVFSAELRDLTGIDNGFFRCGGVEFFDADDSGRETLTWEAEGIAFRRLAVADYEPAVSPPPGMVGVHLPALGQVRNPWHLRALVAACVRVGVRLSPQTPFVGWGMIRDRVVTAQSADAARKSAGAYLIAGGAWAGQMLRPLGVRPPVRPVRGQIVLFRPSSPLFTNVLMVGKRYLVPRADGRVLVGSTEEDAGFEKATTPVGIEELTEFARAMVPALAEADTETTWAGLRPGSPDGMPYLGLVPGQKNVFAAVGHHRAGIQLSIATAEVMTRLVRLEPPPFPVEAFRLDREPDFSVRPAFRS